MRVTTDAVDEFGCGSADELDLMGIEAVEGAGHGTVGVVDLERGSGRRVGDIGLSLIHI